MSNESKFFTVERVVTAVVYAFIIGGAWVRLEYKMNEASDKLLKKIDEHLITDGFEKQIEAIRITQLEKKVEFNASRIADLEEFIRPEEPKIKTYRK